MLGAHYDHLGPHRRRDLSGRRRQRLRHRGRGRAGPRLRRRRTVSIARWCSCCSAPRRSGSSAPATTSAIPRCRSTARWPCSTSTWSGGSRDANARAWAERTAAAACGRSPVAAAADLGVRADLRDSPFGPSDHSRFYAAGAPVLFFHTGSHRRLPSPRRHRRQDRRRGHGAGRRARRAASPSGWPPGTGRSTRRWRGRRAIAGSAAPAPAPSSSACAARARRSPTACVWPRSWSAARRPAPDCGRATCWSGSPIARVDGFEDLVAALRGRQPGDAVRVLYLRDGVEHDTSAVLDARP